MCAAPSNAYRTKSLWARNKANTANIEHLTAIIQTNKATMLSRFYLDDMAVMRLPDGTDGAVGIVNIGSANYEMHNVARHGSMRDGNRVWLNDGGLNTKGIGYSTTSPIIQYANYIIIPSHYLSAYYVDSSRIGYQVRKTGTGPWITPNIIDTPTTLAQAQSLTKNIAVFIFGSPYSEGDRLDVRAFVENAEGTYYSTIQEVVVGKNIDTYTADYRGASASCVDGTPTTVIMNDETREYLKTFTTSADISSGRYIYSSIDSTTGALTPAPEGWYQGLTQGSPQRLIRISSSGEIRQSFLCTAPITDVLVVSFNRVFGLGDDYTAGLLLNRSSAFSSSVTVTGTISEMNGASVVRSFPYTIDLFSGQFNGESEVFTKTNPSFKFKFNSATASPTTVDGTATNPVKIINES